MNKKSAVSNRLDAIEKRLKDLEEDVQKLAKAWKLWMLKQRGVQRTQTGQKNNLQYINSDELAKRRAQKKETKDE